MQPALLIDEVLRHIFHFCLEDGQHILGVLARCCKAWNDPALDYLWMRLSSITPLIQLISGVRLLNGTYVLEKLAVPSDMARFYSYARRVKHINYRHSIQVHPDLLSLLMSRYVSSIPRNAGIFPCLRTAQLSHATCDASQAALSLSANLLHLDLDLGFRFRVSQLSDAGISEYLERVIQVAPGLERFSLRGSASKRLNSVISSMRNIRALSLRTGPSLTTDTLLDVSSFRFLLELEVHAGHINIDELVGSLHNRELPILPSLQKLHLRACSSVIELYLELLSSNTIHTLRIEAEDPARALVSWSPIFKLICSKTAKTLQDLTIERHIELDEMDIDIDASPGSTPDNGTSTSKTNIQIPFNTLRILCHLVHLRRLVLDATLPPDISDREMEIIAGCWPELEYLDLGSIPMGCAEHLGKQRITLQSLAVLAKKSPKLSSLILPADVTGAQSVVVMPSIRSQDVLTRITLGYPSTPDPCRVALFLYRLFPSLMDIDGLPEHEREWNDTQAALQMLRLEAARISAKPAHNFVS